MNLRLLVLLVGCIGVLSPTWAQSWSLAKDKDGIKVYTRKIDDWGIKEYKVTLSVKASFSKVITALKDVPGRYEWLHNILEVREIARPNSDVVTVYNKVDAPWPVSDRDNITQFSFSFPTKTSARVDMKAFKTHSKAPVYSGIVRVERIKGHWIIQDKGNGYVEIMQQCVAEPGGSIPDWLANSAVVDNPFNSMSKFKKYVEGK